MGITFCYYLWSSRLGYVSGNYDLVRSNCNSIGVLVVSLLLGQQHFSINTDALNLGFMLFIFCVGVEAGPNFFPFFSRWENYLMLALVMVGSALVIALGLGKLFGWDIGLTAVC